MSTHVLGNLSVAVLYGIIFSVILKKSILPAGMRTMFSISMGMVFFLFTLGFTLSAFFSPPWHSLIAESIWLALAGMVAVFYLVEGVRHQFFFSVEEMDSSKSKFDKLKDEFLTVASHELRTPLSVINGFGEILVREKLGSLNDEQKRRVRKILMQGQRLNRIIDELLDLSRIRSGKIECRRDLFDMVPVLKACVDDHMIVCEQQKLKLVDEIPDVLPDVVGDLERTTQIVVNLLNNAIKYTEPEGTITITASYNEKDHEVKVSIIDTGIGIDPEDQGNVFKEFFRAQQRHGKKYSGSGLGLTIVTQLVETQGGKVGVFSEGLAKGSTFYFTLPTAKHPKQNSGHHVAVSPLAAE